MSKGPRLALRVAWLVPDLRAGDRDAARQIVVQCAGWVRARALLAAGRLDSDVAFMRDMENIGREMLLRTLARWRRRNGSPLRFARHSVDDALLAYVAAWRQQTTGFRALSAGREPLQALMDVRAAEARSRAVQSALDTMPRLERAVLRERHLSAEPASLFAVARALRMSVDRTRRCEARALARVSAALAALE